MAGRIRHYESVVFGPGLRHCPNEGIVYQEDTSTPIEYGDGYWDNYTKYEHSSIAEALNEFRTSITEKYCSCVLDIGVGCGTFIKKLSIPCYGFDINPRAVEWLLKKGIYRNPYNDIPVEVGGLTLWDVLEHLPNSDDLLTILPLGMYVIVSIPIFEDVRKVRESKHFKKNEHYTYWESKGLKTYMKDIGFDLLETRDDETRIGRESIKTFVFEKVS
jgi:hypothetical protein